MSIFSSVKNMFSGAMGAPAAPSPVAARAALPPRAPAQSAPVNTSVAGLFGLLFSELLKDAGDYLKPPYFFNVIRRGDWVFIRDCQKLSKWGWEAIIKDAGGRSRVFSAEFLAQVATVKDNMKFCDALMAKHSWIEVTPRFLNQQAEAQAAIARGEEPGPLRSREELETETVTTRNAIAAQRRELSQKAYELLQPVCRKLQTVALNIAKELDAQEKAEAEKCQIAFVPSIKLKMLLGFAMEGACGPIMQLNAGAMLMLPEPAEIESLWSPWFDMPVKSRAVPAKVETMRDLYVQPEVRALEKEILERSRAARSEDEKAQERDRREELEEINKLHDLIRKNLMDTERFKTLSEHIKARNLAKLRKGHRK